MFYLPDLELLVPSNPTAELARTCKTDGKHIQAPPTPTTFSNNSIKPLASIKKRESKRERERGQTQEKSLLTVKS